MDALRRACIVSCVMLQAAAGALAQSPACNACADRGVVTCAKCLSSACKHEQPLLFCTEGLDCRDCLGARLVECPKCELSPTVDLAARRAEIAAWHETLKPIDKHLGHELWHCESPHFVLTFDIKRIDTPGASNAHTAMHVYLDRLESLFADFCADLGCAEADFLAKTHVMLWSRESDQVKAATQYTLQHSNTESKLMGAKPVVSIFYDRSHLHEEYELYQAVVHQTAHCLLSNVYDGIWPGNIGAGWLDEGIAHFYENKLFGEVRHYCYVENDTIQYFKFGKWEAAVRTAVDKKEALGFLGVTGVNTVDMTPPQRMFGWSYCDYIVRVSPGRLGRLAKGLKAKKPLTEALAAALEVTPFELEAAWKQWVLATYSPKKK